MIIDFDASFHMTPCGSLLFECKSDNLNFFVKTPDRTPLEIKCIGNLNQEILKIPQVGHYKAKS